MIRPRCLPRTNSASWTQSLSSCRSLAGFRPRAGARDLCLHLGAKMCIECTWGSDIVTAAALHLGAATPPGRVLNVCDLSGYVSPRLASDAPSRSAGRIAPPNGLGLGITIDEGRLGIPDLILD